MKFPCKRNLGGLLLLFCLSLAALAGDAPSREAIVLTVDGPIGPATQDYVTQGLQTAADRRAGLVILRIDTPGGLDTAMRGIVQAILGSPVPVASYVAPEGARAASAGTYILYASHVAVMAPATNLGAATPVQIGGGSSPAPAAPESGDKQNANPAGEASAMQQKMVNDAVAYIRGLAERRGRNADWAEKAVREAASLPAGKALEKNVIDFVAGDLSELLVRADGLQVDVQGRSVTLDTKNLVPERIQPDWRNKLLAVLTNPSVAYILMLIGIYGLVLEGYNPGAIVPGVVGGICLLLALFAFQILPVNYTGLALIALGVILMIAEAFAPSFGALGLGGLVAFIFGSIILMDTDVPGYQIPGLLIGAVSATGGGFMLFLAIFALRSRRQRVVSGAEEMLGAEAVALNDFRDGRGRVHLHGEDWQARSALDIRKGAKVRVTKRHGLILEVKPETENRNTHAETI